MGRWEELDHTADLALHVWGRDLVDLFATAARGMVSLLADVAADGPRKRFDLQLTSPDVESLLVDWLNELLYLHETEGFIGIEFAFAVLTPTELRGEVVGLSLSEPVARIKAATYHLLTVVLTETGYETEVVFDV